MSEKEPVKVIQGVVEIPYKYSYGHNLSRFFQEIKDYKRIWGVRCPRCKAVLVPPQDYCGRCFVNTEEWVQVNDTGIIKAYSVVYMPFKGQPIEPPYVYAELQLNGSNTTFIHLVGGFEFDRWREILRVGMPVRAVWKEEGRMGNLRDILYFEPIDTVKT